MEEFKFAVYIEVKIIAICMRGIIMILIWSSLLHLNLPYCFDCESTDGANKGPTNFRIQQLTTDQIVNLPVEDGILGIKLSLEDADSQAKACNCQKYDEHLDITHN